MSQERWAHLQSLEAPVIALATRLADRLPVADIIDLARHNESFIAIEILISNLDDNDIALADDELAALAMIARELGLDEHYRAAVRTLRRVGEARRPELMLLVRPTDNAESLYVAIDERLAGEAPSRLILVGWDAWAVRLPQDARDVLEALHARGMQPVFVTADEPATPGSG